MAIQSDCTVNEYLKGVNGLLKIRKKQLSGRKRKKALPGRSAFLTHRIRQINT